MADFFDQDNNEGQNSPKNQQQDDQYDWGGDNQQQSGFENQDQQQDQGFDYFGGDNQDKSVENTSQQQVYQPPENAFDQSQKNDQASTGYNPAGGENTQVLDPETLERQRVQQELDAKRTQDMVEKQEKEQVDKEARKKQAKEWLRNWEQEQQRDLEARKKINKQAEDVKKSGNSDDQYKNQWDKIASNISLKASDYPGKKDVNRMKESIINKKADLLTQKN